jgi:hypothetical protein
MSQAKRHASDTMRNRRDAVNTIVIATCATCEDVELDPRDIELRLCSHTPASTYRFICPSCGDVVEKPADDQEVVNLLMSAGVRTVVWELPAEMLEPREGAPISGDDVLDFMLGLERPDWFELLTKTSQRTS